MRCPTCATDVPAARFCARCGDRLRAPTGDGPPADSTGRRLRARLARLLPDALPRAAVLASAAAAVVLAVTATAAWLSREPPPGQAPDDRVSLPAAASAGGVAGSGTTAAPGPTMSPFEPSRSATVLCSDLSEHRIKYAWLDEAGVGEMVEVHGTPCIVTEIEPEAGDAGPVRIRPNYPRGDVPRGSRPGPVPSP